MLFKLQPLRHVFLCLALATMVLGCASSTTSRARIIAQETPLAFSARALNVPFDKPGYGKVLIIAEVRFLDLQFTKADSMYYAGVEATFTLESHQNSEQIILQDIEKDVVVGSFLEAASPDSVLRIVHELEAQYGNYTAKILISDKNSSGAGGVSHIIQVRDLRTTFSITEPLLTREALTRFDVNKLIPLKTQSFTDDFFAIVMLGGLKAEQPISIGYRLTDTQETTLYERSVNVSPDQSTVLISLPIPADKLAIGTTILRVAASQLGQTVSSVLRIKATLGYTASKEMDIGTLVGPMRYVMNKSQFNELRNATPEEQAELFGEFWKKRDPTPKNDANPLLDEFYRRVEVANARFDWAGTPGFETDRGRTLIEYGPPDSIENTNRVGSVTNYEIWIYHEFRRRFVFIDRHNDGNYQLLTSTQ